MIPVLTIPVVVVDYRYWRRYLPTMWLEQDPIELDYRFRMEPIEDEV